MARVVRVARSSSSLFGFGSRFYSTTAASTTSGVTQSSLFLHGGGARKEAVKDRNVQWVSLGCPGVGKGTYASRLSSLLGVPHIATGDLVREELVSSGHLSQQFQTSHLCRCGLISSSRSLPELVTPPEPPEPPDPPDPPPDRASPVPPLHLCTFEHYYNVKVQHGFHLHHVLHSRSPYTIALPGYQYPRLPACSGRHVKRESDLVLGVLGVYTVTSFWSWSQSDQLSVFRFKDRNSESRRYKTF